MSRTWRTRALIDLSALRHNVKVIRELAGEARVYAVVKADAYGHGINNVVPAIRDSVDGFAVATLEEGIRCRKSAINNAIMVLSEFSGPCMSSNRMVVEPASSPRTVPDHPPGVSGIHSARLTLSSMLSRLLSRLRGRAAW